MSKQCTYVFEVIVKTDPLGQKEKVALETTDRMEAYLCHVIDQYGHGLIVRTYELDQEENRTLVKEEARS